MGGGKHGDCQGRQLSEEGGGRGGGQSREGLLEETGFKVFACSRCGSRREARMVWKMKGRGLEPVLREEDPVGGGGCRGALWTRWEAINHCDGDRRHGDGHECCQQGRDCVLSGKNQVTNE